MRRFRVAGRAARGMLGHDIFAEGTMQEREAYHYGVIRRAIAAIAARAPEQVPLERLAAEVGMSPAHFQRVFSQWAGVSPKRYQQYLALDAAKRLLAERRTVIDTALEAGLSGPGRLHDLFVTWEAMSPGDYARGGAGLEIAWGWFQSPFGPVLGMATGRGLCGLAFAAEVGEAAAMDDMTARWPGATFVAAPERVAPLLGDVFRGRGGARLHLIGGPFQIKVWEALMRVPSGRVTTYSDIAAAIGRPGAARAVGTAVGRNPVAWLVPCHRVLRREGGLGGYHWGLGVKRAMLAWESARAEAGAPA